MINWSTSSKLMRYLFLLWLVFMIYICYIWYRKHDWFIHVWLFRFSLVLMLGFQTMIYRSNHHNVSTNPFINLIELVMNFNTFIDWSGHSINWSLYLFNFRIKLVGGINVRIDGTHHWRLKWLLSCHFIKLIVRIIRFALINRANHFPS